MPSIDSDAPAPPPGDPSQAAAEGRHVRGRETWDRAREDYLGGDSAPRVCDRYGLKESTLRDRARKEGWRKSDQPDPDPVEDDVDDDDSPVDCAALADDALLRVRRALKRGRAGEAASWMRLHEKLVRRLAELEEAERRRRRVDDERGAYPAPSLHPTITALEAAIELAKIRAERNLADLSAEIARERGGRPPADPHPSHPSHDDFFDDDFDDAETDLDLDPALILALRLGPETAFNRR